MTKTTAGSGTSAPARREVERRRRRRRAKVVLLAGAVVGVAAITGCVVDTDRDGIADVDEIRIGWDPTDPDQDADGVVDGRQDTDADHVVDWIELSLGTDPHPSAEHLDSDHDGLDDEHERVLRTDPADPDTDHDRLPDTEGFDHETDPNDADSDDDGLGDRDEVELFRTDPNRSDPGRTGGEDATGVTLTDEIGSIDPAFWEQCSARAPAAFDELSVVDGWVTVHEPDDGPIDSPAHGAAHGCAVHEFGAWASDEVEVAWTWSAQRPLEATPLLHVDLDTDEGGIGMWPVHDVFPAIVGNQSVWALGYIGRDNAHFRIVAATPLTGPELAAFSDPRHPAAPTTIRMRSADGQISVLVDGRELALSMVVPPALAGSTTHGFAIDNNQTNLVGGPRTPDLPAGRGPWSIHGIASPAADVGA